MNYNSITIVTRLTIITRFKHWMFVKRKTRVQVISVTEKGKHDFEPLILAPLTIMKEYQGDNKLLIFQIEMLEFYAKFDLMPENLM